MKKAPTFLLILSNVNLAPIQSKMPKSTQEWKVLVDGFNQIDERLINGYQDLNQTPDYVWIHADLNFPGILPEYDIDQKIEDTIAFLEKKLHSWLKHTQSYPETTFLFSIPHFKIFWNKGQSRCSDRETLQSLVTSLFIQQTRTFPNVTILPFQALIHRLGEKSAYDPRLWTLGRIPYSYPCLEQLASSISTSVENTKTPPKKVLFLDLDNTLWGGILDEVGPENLLLSTDGIGFAYYSFQKAILSLKRRGILLIILSKNERERVVDVINNHPFMILKQDDFVDIQANWNRKSANIVATAKHLNLPFDSFVVIDDSPRERLEIKNQLPEVSTPDFPADPANLVTWIYETIIPNYFDTSEVTEEDFQRTENYLARKRRTAESENHSTIEDYLTSLKINLTIEKAKTSDQTRVTQLLSKTNQFNSNKAFLPNERHWNESLIWKLHYRDTFGNEGLVGTIVYEGKENLVIKQIALSCRVFNRQIEHAFLLKMIEELNPNSLSIEWIPTNKNKIVSRFIDELSKHGPMKPWGSKELKSIQTNLLGKTKHIRYEP